MNGATGAASGGAGTGSPLPEARDGRPPQPHQPPQAYAPPQAALPAPQQGQQQSGGYEQPGGYGQQGQQAGFGVPGPAAGPGARRPRPAARTAPRTRKARLRVSKADPWSVMKVSFLLSIALGVCTVVAVRGAVDGDGRARRLRHRGGPPSATPPATTPSGFDLQSFLSLPRVLMFTSVIAVIDVVLATALATLGVLPLQHVRGLRRRHRADPRGGRVAGWLTNLGQRPRCANLSVRHGAIAQTVRALP